MTGSWVEAPHTETTAWALAILWRQDDGGHVLDLAVLGRMADDTPAWQGHLEVASATSTHQLHANALMAATNGLAEVGWLILSRWEPGQWERYGSGWRTVVTPTGVSG